MAKSSESGKSSPGKKRVTKRAPADSKLPTLSVASSATRSAREKTRIHLKSLFDLFKSHAGDVFFPDSVSEAGRAVGTRQGGEAGRGSGDDSAGRRTDSGKSIGHHLAESRYSLVLNALKLLPWIYSAGFVLSFFWDFTGMTLRLLGWGIALEGLLRILSVSGLIGFLTNWLAITMLFRPAKRRPLLGQGLIPANKDRVALRLSRAVAEDLINPELIQRKIHESQWIRTARIHTTESLRTIVDNPEFRSGLRNWMRSYVEDLISDADLRADLAKSILLKVEEYLKDRSIERFAYRAYTFLKGNEAQILVEEALEKIPETVDEALNKVDDLLDDLPGIIEKNSEKIEDAVTTLLFRLINRLNVEQLVLENLIQYDESRLEKMIKGATHEQLSYIQYLGALLGGIGGLVIWEPLLSLAVFGAIGGGLLIADTAMIHFTRDKLSTAHEPERMKSEDTKRPQMNPLKSSNRRTKSKQRPSD